MFIAKDINTNSLIHIDEVKKEEKGSYTCPVCGGEVIKKMGSTVAHHFAHKALVECDTFTQDMSEWHKWWQNQFPKNNQEHIERLTISVEEYENASEEYNFATSKTQSFIKRHKDQKEITLLHRTDVRACGYVIEFQHSPISREEFNERNWFYRMCGCKVVWIFDMTQLVGNSIHFCSEAHKYGKSEALYKWNHPKKTFVDMLPQYNKKHRDFKTGNFYDSEILLFFQFTDYDSRNPDECIIEQVVWAIDDGGFSDFKRFKTEYTITSPEEFYEAIVKRIL